MNNVIQIDPAAFYCMRQCQEAMKHLKTLNDPVYDVEIKGEKELYRTFMAQTLNRAA